MNLPYDMVRMIIQKAGLSHDCMRYIRFDRHRMNTIPNIIFPEYCYKSFNTFTICNIRDRDFTFTKEYDEFGEDMIYNYETKRITYEMYD